MKRLTPAFVHKMSQVILASALGNQAKKANDSKEKDDSSGCFTSPSGHRCCSREVEVIIKQMAMVVSNEIDDDDNATTIYRAMLRYIAKESTKKFCTPFETIISKGEFAAKSHTNGTNEQDGVALGCKMQIKIGGRKRIRRSDEGIDSKPAQNNGVFIILSYSTVFNANDKNSKSISFPGHPEPPSSPPANSGSLGNPGNSASSSNANNAASFAEPPLAPPVPPAPPAPPPPEDRLCFSKDGIVETDAGFKRMRELAIGDHVLATERRL
uniref:Uncharacterized protein n=1 Tax=Plectus sambesii TaxID=2011161 RepID=A0A914XFG2_9BILA